MRNIFRRTIHPRFISIRHPLKNCLRLPIPQAAIRSSTATTTSSAIVQAQTVISRVTAFGTSVRSIVTVCCSNRHTTNTEPMKAATASFVMNPIRARNRVIAIPYRRSSIMRRTMERQRTPCGYVAGHIILIRRIAPTTTTGAMSSTTRWPNTKAKVEFCPEKPSTNIRSIRRSRAR